VCGTALLQIARRGRARHRGASTAKKCARCLELGADAAINYTQENLRDALKTLTGGKGPTSSTTQWAATWPNPRFDRSPWRGRYLVIGFTQGGIPALPWNLPLLKGASIVGVFWGEFVRREPEANAQALRALMQWYAQGRVKPVLDQVLPMARLHDAYARMAAREVIGKLVLVNS
jgi:NADPH2:quinone reductase